MSGIEPDLSNFLARCAVLGGMRTPRSKLGKVMMYAPVALELLNLVRRSQKKRRGRYARATKRDRALDFLLSRVERRLKKHGVRR